MLRFRLSVDKDGRQFRPSFDETTELGLDDTKIDSASLDCALGDVSEVRNFMNTPDERDIFIKGKDHNGRTAPISAAPGGCAEMVHLLIAEGSDVGAASHNGQTALMEASLLGLLENVEILLHHGADKDTKDSFERTALDLAKPVWQNGEERFGRAGGRHQFYKKDTYSRDKDRREIFRPLDNTPEKKEKLHLSHPVLITFPSSNSGQRALSSY